MPSLPQKPLRSGDRIDKYIVEKEIGRGGYGHVYRAKHEFLDTRVALKVVERTGGLGSTHKQRVEQEARVLGKLRHPNIVTVYDGGQDGDRVFIAMEELEGLNLGQHLRKHGPFDVVSGLRVLSSVCAALDCAHGQGIIHRDLKPGNLFLCSNGTVKILDFGIAKVVGSDIRTQDNIYLGTAPYMSPEQITHRRVDCRTDVYAVGLIAFEMFFGKRPLVVARPEVKGMESRDILDLQLVVPTPRLDELLDDFPSYVARLVTTATAKDPAQRYDAVLALKNKVDAHLKQYLQEVRLEDSQGSPRRTMKLFPGIDPIRNPTTQELSHPSSSSVGRESEKLSLTASSADITPPPSATDPYSESDTELAWNRVLPFVVLGLAAVGGVVSFDWFFGPAPSRPTEKKAEAAAAQPVPLVEKVEAAPPKFEEGGFPDAVREDDAPSAETVSDQSVRPDPPGEAQPIGAASKSPPDTAKKTRTTPPNLFRAKERSDTIPVEPPPAKRAAPARPKQQTGDQELWLE